MEVLCRINLDVPAVLGSWKGSVPTRQWFYHMLGDVWEGRVERESAKQQKHKMEIHLS